MSKLFSINQSLVKRLRKGDLVAFDEIYNAYFHKIYNFTFKIIKLHEDTEEIVQEVFIKLWEGHEKINLDSSFNSYLFTIAYNLSISSLRKKISQQKYADYVIHTHNPIDDTDIQDEIIASEMNEQLRIAIDKLPTRQKEIFTLSRLDGLTHKQIAEKLEISENTVKNQIVTALKFLRKVLTNDELNKIVVFLVKIL